MSRGFASCGLLCTALMFGCGKSAPPLPKPPPTATSSGYGIAATDEEFREGSKLINFLDEVAAQPAPPTDLKTLSLVDLTGQPATLGDVAPGKHLVVMMMRGFSGAVCPYCSTQVARTIAKYGDIAAQNAEVVLIYPVESEASRARYDEFLGKLNSIDRRPQMEPLPFPVLLDVGLKVVDALGIRKDLSKPATYILDPQGGVRFAYVGNTLNDRPSVKAILQQLQQLQAANKAG